jgi:hypothetical protein
VARKAKAIGAHRRRAAGYGAHAFFAATGAIILAYSGHPQRGRAVRSAAEFQQGGL